MRDAHYFTENIRQEVRTYPSDDFWFNYWSPHVSTNSWRDDSASTNRGPMGYYQPTPYGAFFSFCGSQPCDYVYRTWDGTFRRIGAGTTETAFPFADTYGCNSAFPYQPDIPISLILACQSRALAQVRAGNWNAGQFLGELPETLKFIISTARTVLDIYKYCKNRGRDPGAYERIAQDVAKARNANKFYKNSDGQWRRVKEHKPRSRKPLPRPSGTETASDLWLSYQFGWKPLLNDIYSACEFIRDGISQPNVCSAFAEMEDGSYSPPTLNGVGDLSGSFKRGVKVEFNYRVTNESLYLLQMLGLASPLAIAWELLPMSFVLDWFFPIGTFLEGLSSNIGLTFDSGYQTMWLKNSWKAEWVNHGEAYMFGSKPAVIGRTTSFRRQIFLDFPYSFPFSLKTGFFHHAGQQWSALALTIQKLR